MLNHFRCCAGYVSPSWILRSVLCPKNSAAGGNGVLSRDHKNSILRDPCSGNCGMTRFIWVETEGCSGFHRLFSIRPHLGKNPILFSLSPEIGPMSRDCVPCQSLVQFLAVLGLAGTAMSSTQAGLGDCLKSTQLLGPHSCCRDSVWTNLASLLPERKLLC